MKVTIVQRVLPHYRHSLFRLLQKQLASKGIDFQLVYGQEYPDTVPKTVHLDESWAHKIDNQYISVADKKIVWQPCIDLIISSDLLIFEQANFLLLNYWLIFKRKWFKKTKIAYWGHGKNMQAISDQSLSEKLKERMINQVDWWFAYTDITKQMVKNSGFCNNEITELQNAVDTVDLKNAIIDIKPEKLVNVRNYLGLSKGAIGLYCGGMYEGKNLDFLIKSAILIKASVPEFQLLLIGDGPEQFKAEKASKNFEWIHYLGSKFGEDRAVYFKLADIFLMPCLIGLAILDSFTAGLPVFTTNATGHGPEISYLRQGNNGFISPFITEAYSDSVVAYLLSDEATKLKFMNSCFECADNYTIKNMAKRFADGIQECLTR